MRWVKLPDGGESYVMRRAGEAAKSGEPLGNPVAEVVYVGDHVRHPHCVVCGDCMDEGRCRCG